MTVKLFEEINAEIDAQQRANPAGDWAYMLYDATTYRQLRELVVSGIVKDGEGLLAKANGAGVSSHDIIQRRHETVLHQNIQPVAVYNDAANPSGAYLKLYATSREQEQQLCDLFIDMAGKKAAAVKKMLPQNEGASLEDLGRISDNVLLLNSVREAQGIVISPERAKKIEACFTELKDKLTPAYWQAVRPSYLSMQTHLQEQKRHFQEAVGAPQQEFSSFDHNQDRALNDVGELQALLAKAAKDPFIGRAELDFNRDAQVNNNDVTLNTLAALPPEQLQALRVLCTKNLHVQDMFGALINTHITLTGDSQVTSATPTAGSNKSGPEVGR